MEEKKLTCFCYWDKLAVKDVRKLKEYLEQWATQDEEKAMLVNTTVFSKIYERMSDQQVEGSLSMSTHKLYIEDILIEWYQLGGRKGILKRIMSTSGKGVLYNEPPSWDSIDIWYEFK